jgi:hypothetical protein
MKKSALQSKDFHEIRSKITFIPLEGLHLARLEPETMALFEEVLGKYDMLRNNDLSSSFQI